MSRIDETRPFIPVRIAVLTISDTRTLETDKSGNSLTAMIAEAGHALSARSIVKDDIRAIAELHDRVDAAIVGKALYAGRFTVEEALAACSGADPVGDAG